MCGRCLKSHPNRTTIFTYITKDIQYQHLIPIHVPVFTCVYIYTYAVRSFTFLGRESVRHPLIGDTRPADSGPEPISAVLSSQIPEPKPKACKPHILNFRLQGLGFTVQYFEG